jgi:hypothetical protein
MSRRLSRSEKLKLWRKANPEKVREANKRSYLKHRGKLLEYQEKYRQANRERLAAEQRARRKRWTPEQRERARQYKRAYQLQKRYGITVEQYDELLAAQGGKCAICQTTRRGTYNVLDVDHCHQTGKVRGLLCTSCNSAIALLGDDAEGVGRALKYMKRCRP